MAGDERPHLPDALDSDTGVSLADIPLHSTNLLTVLDEDGVIQYESPSISRIFGFDQDELVDEPVAQYFHPDDREAVIRAFRTVVESDEYSVEVVEYRHQQADGTYLWVESVASANPTPEGNYVINTRDISDRKSRERELERTNERLDRFASFVSHDLRNPLNVAMGRLQLAREECDNEHLAVVARSHERMENLIDGLLTLTRVGDEATERRPVELASLADECWQTVETRGASLSLADDLVVQADEDRLRQLMENLFRNAIEHGGEDVAVGVGELPDGRGFYVEDDGPGIPESAGEEVFESGYSTREMGTGLGLAIVRQIVEAHAWDITVKMSEEGGARFEISDVDIDS